MKRCNPSNGRECGNTKLHEQVIFISTIFIHTVHKGNLQCRIEQKQSQQNKELVSAPVPVSGIWVEHALLIAFLLVASAILFVTHSESSFPVAIKAFHYLDVPWFIVLTLLLALDCKIILPFRIGL